RGQRYMAKRKQIRTDISWSTEDTITIKGLDLCRDIMGKVSLGDMAFLELTDRLPNERESRVFYALAVDLVEHGMTPSAILTRMTACGATEAVQAAVAARLNRLGSVFVGSMENAARLLQTALPDPAAAVDMSGLARQIVAQQRSNGSAIPGIGHHIHKPVDPRAPRLFDIAEENGFSRSEEH